MKIGGSLRISSTAYRNGRNGSASDADSDWPPSAQETRGPEAPGCS